VRAHTSRLQIDDGMRRWWRWEGEDGQIQAAARSVCVRASRGNRGRQAAQVSRGAKMGSDAERGRAEGSWLVADLRRQQR
jgi:hypothetical protein